MSTKVASLFAELGLKDDSFKRGVSGAKTSLLSLVNPATIAATSVAAIGAAALKTFNEFQAYALDVADLADKLGTTTEEASALREMAGDLGVGMGSVQMAFKTMSQNGIPPTVAGLAEVRAQLDATSSAEQRMALVTKLMGRSGLDLLPIFAQLNDTELRDYIRNLKDGQIVTAAEAKTARELRDQLDQLNDSWTDLGRVMSSEFAPSAVSVLDFLNRAVTASQETKVDFLNLDETLVNFGVHLRDSAQERDKAASQLERMGQKAEFFGQKVVEIPELHSTVASFRVAADTSRISQLAKRWHVSEAVVIMVLMGKISLASLIASGVATPVIPGENPLGKPDLTPDKVGKALGGPLTSGIHEVGEVGTEGIINGRVIPHSEWTKMKQGLWGVQHHAIEEGTGPMYNPVVRSLHTATDDPVLQIYGSYDAREAAVGRRSGSASAVAGQAAFAAAAGMATQAATQAAAVSVAGIATQIPVAVAQQTRESNRIVASGIEGLRLELRALKTEIARAVRDAVQMI